MNSENSIDSVLSNIYKNGKYYNPAWTHYQEGAVVSCDRCKRTQLNVCIGWKEYDMCLKCVEEMSIVVPRKLVPTIKKDDDWKEQTLMMQDMYRTNMQQDMYRTKMRQDMYRTNMQQDIEQI